MIEAWFTYNAATRPDMLPRIPTPGASDKIVHLEPTEGVRAASLTPLLPLPSILARLLG